MAVNMTSDAEIERLTAAVADRFAASAKAAPLGQAKMSASLKSPVLVDRLASAVAQRLAARAGSSNIDRLASAVAHRLSASTGAARLASGAARHFAGDLIWSDPELDRLVSSVGARLSNSQ